MTKRIRLIILAFAIACFLIIAPVALLYGWGYRYDFRDKIFIQTGAIYLKSLPRKAKVCLSGVERKKKTPLIIDGLLPNKKYEILVELEGFWPWQKTLEVKPTLVTEAKNILLIPENPKIIPLENKSEIEVREFLLSPDKEKLAFSFYTNEENSSGIWILNLKEKDKIILIDNKVLGLKQSYDNFADFQWSADSNKLLFSAWDKPRTENLVRGKTGKEIFFTVDLEDLSKIILEPPEQTDSLATSTPLREGVPTEKLNGTGIINLTNIIGENPSKFLWHPQKPSLLLWIAPTKKENSLFQLDLSDENFQNETFEIVTKGIIDFTVNQNDIYMIKKGLLDTFIIYKNNFEVSSIPEDLGKPQEIFILEKRGLALKTDEDKTYLLILQDNNPLPGDTPPLFLLAKEIREVKLSPDKNKILYWQAPHRDEVSGAGQDGEIKIYFLKRFLSYKKEIGDIETISLDFPIDQVLWYKDSEHLIYVQGNKIRITEIDPRGERNDVTFTEGEKPIYDPARDILYFLNKGNLYKVKFP